MAVALLLSASSAWAVEEAQPIDPKRFEAPVNPKAQEAPVDPKRFGPMDAPEPKDALGPSPVKILKAKPLDPGAVEESEPGTVDSKRFGKQIDEAYGAFQRGLYVTAYNLAKPRADQGDAAAQTLLAELLLRGLGVKTDQKAAADWYGKASAQGIPEAQFQYALILLDGKHAQKDPAKALELMKKAADQGNTLAQFNLAQLYVQEAPGEAGFVKALPYYESAAVTGLPDAQYAMSQIFANGVGGKKQDLAAARRFLLLAAKQGFDTAQVELGTWMVDGRGGERDAKEGFNWLKRAAEGGNVAAMNRLAKLYMYGVGTDPNSIDAAAWYFLARREGLNDAEMTDFLAGLTSEETKKALERANRLR